MWANKVANRTYLGCSLLGDQTGHFPSVEKKSKLVWTGTKQKLTQSFQHLRESFCWNFVGVFWCDVATGSVSLIKGEITRWIRVLLDAFPFRNAAKWVSWELIYNFVLVFFALRTQNLARFQNLPVRDERKYFAETQKWWDFIHVYVLVCR